MLIDWPTVIFQIINFLILVLLLKRFLYGPVIKAMDEREKKIADRLVAAAAAEKEAAEHAARLARKQEEFAQSRENMQQEAYHEIETWKAESIERLKNEIAAQKKIWQNGLEEEKEAFLSKLQLTIISQVFEVARKAFSDLADEQLETRLIDTFLKKIDAELSHMETRHTAHDSISILSGFPLQSREKERLELGLRPFFPQLVTMHFQEKKELGFGLRLLAGNHKWEWNVNRYMRDAEAAILQSMGMK